MLAPAIDPALEADTSRYAWRQLPIVVKRRAVGDESSFQKSSTTGGGVGTNGYRCAHGSLQSGLP